MNSSFLPQPRQPLDLRPRREARPIVLNKVNVEDQSADFTIPAERIVQGVALLGLGYVALKGLQALAAWWRDNAA